MVATAGLWASFPREVGHLYTFLPEVGIHKEGTKPRTDFNVTGMVCKLETKIQKNTKMELLGILISQSFAGLPMLTSEMHPENFRSLS